MHNDLLAAVLAACLAPAVCVAQVVQSRDTRYEAAQTAYENGHYESAFAAFADLADEGHCDAVRIVQQMLRHGPKLYRSTFKADLARTERWQRETRCRALASVAP